MPAARRDHLGTIARHAPLVAALALAAACSAPERPESDAEQDVPLVDVPVPPADGPKLVAMRRGVVVRDRPGAKGKELGTLRAGARVVRAAEAYSTKGCAGGWYPIRPKGFVCAGDEASIDLESLPARLLDVAPNLDKPLPYRYARMSRGAGVAYAALPTEVEQLAAEPVLKQLDKRDPRRIGTGANDVPLDELGLATGLAVLSRGGEGVGEDGYRTDAAFFQFGRQTGALPPGTNLSGGENIVLKEHSGVALIDSFVAGARAFGITPDGHFVPLDRLRPALGSEHRGIDLAKISLPVAFALRTAGFWKMEEHKVFRTDEEVEAREAVQLTGRYRTKYKTKFFQTTQDDLWVRAKDIVYVPKRHEFPDFAGADTRWLDVSLATQQLVAWQGKTPVFATLISSGEDRIGDPAQGPATKQGVFHVRAKHITLDIDDREVRGAHSVSEAPWVIDFDEGFALSGCYWHGTIGEARSYHNIALSPIDARWLFNWLGPAIPEGWHSARFEESIGGAVIYVHK